MIDIDKIEAAAKAAFQIHQTRQDADASHLQFVITSNPATVLEMVSMIRERDAVLKQALEALYLARAFAEGGKQTAREAVAAIKGVLGGSV